MIRFVIAIRHIVNWRELQTAIYSILDTSFITCFCAGLLLQVDRMHSNRCIQKWRQNDVLREEHLKWCLSRDFLMQQKCPVLVQPVLIFFETKHIQRKMLQTFERSVFKGKL